MNDNGTADLPTIEGSCQCGRVRYHVAAGPAFQSVCHCRMCQRATGNAFAPLIEVDNVRVTYHGAPQTWASSNVAERGFCPACGTPLFYRTIGADTTEFMAGSIISPIAFTPTENHGIECLHPWVHEIATLPGRETYFDEGTPPVVSHQWEPRN